MRKKQIDHYEESTVAYTEMLKKAWSADYPRLERYFAKIMPKIEQMLANKKTKIKALDIGCGIGFGLKFLAKNGFKQLYGIDINKHSLEEARKVCPEAKIKFGDVYRIPFDAQTFDLIFLTEIIEHLDFPDQAFEEISRILKSGGVLFLTTPNRMGLMGLSNGPIKFLKEGFYWKSLLRILGKVTCGPEHPREYFSFELANILTHYSFRDIIYPFYTYFPLFPSGKYYILAKKRGVI